MGQRQQRGGAGIPTPNIPDADLKTIIQSEDEIQSAKLTVQHGEKFGRYLQDRGLKTAQIRNLFSQVRQIEMNWPRDEERDGASMRELLLLKPKMAYQSQRVKEVADLTDLLSRGIDLVDNRVQFQRFVDFFEAILAYHKEGNN